MSTIISPTNIPTGGRRPIPVSLPRRFPADVPAVFRRAARIIAANGLHQGDYVRDPFDRVSTRPHALRPMCLVGALRTAATGNPGDESPLAWEAIRALAGRLLVQGEGPWGGGEDESLRNHVSAWNDAECRTAESAIAVLEQAADAVAVSL